MNRAGMIAAVCGCGVVAGAALAEPGPWVNFVNETTTRLVAPPGLGVSDPDEKDFAWGDLDQDDDIDLVVARKQPFTSAGRRPNVLLMNEGGVLTDRTAEYASASTVAGDEGFLTPTNDRDIFVADVTGDGWLDVITSPTYGAGQPTHISHPRIYVNLGEDESGNWLGLEYQAFRIPTFPAAPNFCAVGVGDVTGDDAADLYFVDYDFAGFSSPGFDDRLLINDGSGVFTDQSALRVSDAALASGFGHSGWIEDMNGDDHADLIKGTALGEVPTRVNISYNNPLTPGFFPQNLWQPGAAGGATYFFSVGDLNNDSRMDLLVTDDATDHYHLNQGSSGGMAIWNSLIVPSSSAIGGNTTIADINNDGWEDFILSGNDVDFSGCRPGNIYQNQANPPNVTFSVANAGIPTSVINGNHDAAVFDVDGDGWKDIVFGNCTGLSVWINVPPDLPGPEADLNGDDVVDGLDLGILLANWSIPAGSPGCGGTLPCPADLNDDGVVDGLDLGMLLAQWTI